MSDTTPTTPGPYQLPPPQAAANYQPPPLPYQPSQQQAIHVQVDRRPWELPLAITLWVYVVLGAVLVLVVLAGGVQAGY